MRIVRGPRPERYTTLDNAVVRDERLSYAARGLLAYLLSHRDGWETSARRLEAAGPDGRRAVASALRELETAGYLSRNQARDQRGRWSPLSWTVRDTPHSDDLTTFTALPHADSRSDLQEQDVSAGRTALPHNRVRSFGTHKKDQAEEVTTAQDQKPVGERNPGDDDPVREVMARTSLPATYRQDVSAAVFDRGWPLDRLVAYLTDGTADTRNPTAVAIHRLANIGDPPVRSYRWRPQELPAVPPDTGGVPADIGPQLEAIGRRYALSAGGTGAP